MSKVRVAFIGVGHDHAVFAYESVKKQSDVYDVAGYYIPKSEKKDFSEKLDVLSDLKELTLEEIMNDSKIDAVIIETEEINLTKYAVLAAKNKKHIHMDKPGGMDMYEFEELINTAQQNKLVLHLGYMYRYNPEVQKLKEAVKKGELGEVFAVETQMNGIFPSTTEKRQWLSTFKGGMMFFLGCHLVDIVVSIQGVPEKIIPFNTYTGIDGTTSEDYGMAIFQYKNGISFVKSCAAEVAGGARRQIVVCGSKKTVEIKPIEIQDGNSITSCVAHYQNNIWIPDEKYNSEAFDRYDTMMKSFAQYAMGEKENPWTYEHELKVYKCLLKACGYKKTVVSLQ